ncbi:uncharacterized protein LOC129921204 [Episyrphus balteatus]|uniref:uncharacterized protein LOC129913972 n=1 Tax=Episyrphus balteatus TaxID=286459 RepID=UPI002484EB3D|nr:uncharacterized protein LOC129913972 [Episyrphus balteatus]XP_055848964.1 uncharacterized protein LOC129913972 [Episyrphus balteatus]XP_055858910.1 uncharacterized protein LOC129921204 [Episyrphus balteatus]XP_055858911.1 uncharacterized protein LOC129921204 [Episyrphus balteatus]
MATNRARSSANAIKSAKLFVQTEEFQSLTLYQAKLRLATLEGDWAKYQNLADDSLDVVSKKDLPKILGEIEAVRNDYFTAGAALQQKVQESIPSSSVQGSTLSEGDNRQIQVEVNMPFQQHDLNNTWGSFDGAYTKWIGFHDRFKAAIHDNPKVSPAFKFQYLKNSLVGRAARALGEWQLSEENYNEAWDRLNQVYNKRYLIGREHLRQIISLPEIRGRPSANTLQRMADATHEALRQLKALDLPVEHWDFFIVHLLCEKFDQETARQWELQRESEQPKLSTLLAFIDKQAAALCSVTVEQQARNASTSYKEERQRTAKVQDTKPAVSGRPQPLRKACEVCGSWHPIWECPEFASLSFRGKGDFIERRALCPNCLKHGHKENNCFMRGCARCPGAPKHNIFLCPMKEVLKPMLPLIRNEEEKAGTRGAMRKRGVYKAKNE